MGCEDSSEDMPKVDLSSSGQMFLCWEQETFLMACHTQQELSDKRACGVCDVLLKVYGKLVGTDSPLAGSMVLR